MGKILGAGGGGGGGGIAELLQRMQGGGGGAQGGGFRGALGGGFGQIGQALGGQQAPMKPQPSPWGNPGGMLGQGKQIPQLGSGSYMGTPPPQPRAQPNPIAGVYGRQSPGMFKGRRPPGGGGMSGMFGGTPWEV